MQTASSSSCCGCGSIWRFPSIQYGLHAILPGQRHCGQRVSRLLGRFYGRKLRGPLLQRCDRAVLPCGVTCDRATVAETTCDRLGVSVQHAHTQKESERMGGRAVTVCVSLTFHLIGVHFDIVWCTLRHREVYSSTSCVPRTWSSYPKAGAKCWSSIVKDCRI